MTDKYEEIKKDAEESKEKELENVTENVDGEEKEIESDNSGEEQTREDIQETFE